MAQESPTEENHTKKQQMTPDINYSLDAFSSFYKVSFECNLKSLKSQTLGCFKWVNCDFSEIPSNYYIIKVESGIRYNEKEQKKSVCMYVCVCIYIYNWVTSLYTRNKQTL